MRCVLKAGLLSSVQLDDGLTYPLGRSPHGSTHSSGWQLALWSSQQGLQGTLPASWSRPGCLESLTYLGLVGWALQPSPVGQLACPELVHCTGLEQAHRHHTMDRRRRPQQPVHCVHAHERESARRAARLATLAAAAEMVLCPGWQC